MKEVRQITALYREANAGGRRCALATVVSVRGSTYRRTGARMLVTEDGESVGCVSGGCLEADVVKKALLVLAGGTTTLVTYDTHDDDDVSHGVGVGCRGEVTLLVEALPRERTHLAQLAEWLERREVGLVATVVRSGAEVAVGTRLLLGDAGIASDDLGDPDVLAEARELLAERRGETRRYERTSGMLEVCFEIVSPPPLLVLFGAGHDAEPLFALAKSIGWHVTVVEVRAGNRTRERFRGADAVIVASPEAACAQVTLRPDTAAVIMTHNYGHDRRLLELLLPSQIGYLGLLGPRDRAERLLGELGHAARGRLHAPVGLDIGAETPEEIALAVVAEIRAFLADRSGGPLRDRRGPFIAAESRVQIHHGQPR